ncbi:hypothetical protein [Gordonia soli]|uniref:Uncharacterized protein n=1 Tax=Gordonia soli NBRC 108243 TaxID=1223545 RepID=M0QPV7_9ACTN|nr:hypothetical protein [Gordonia soli]GAC70725.1 hypothetical protein GS4_39_00560 [Gordonia soli NBRC 108243]
MAHHECGDERPKIAEALGYLRTAPWEIESGLQAHYPGRLLAEWFCTIAPSLIAHQKGERFLRQMLARNGGMTSRELVALIETFPDHSQYRRRYEPWTIAEQVAARASNDLRIANRNEDVDVDDLDLLQPPDAPGYVEVSAPDNQAVGQPTSDDLWAMWHGQPVSTEEVTS